MTVETTNLNEVTDEQIESKLSEISSKPDKTEDDVKEIETLKKEKTNRYQKRIDQLTWKTKSTAEELENERKKREELEAEIERLKGKEPETTQKIKRTTVTAGGQTYFTNEALRDMIDKGEITEAEAYKHQEERITALASDMAYQKIKSEESMKTAQETLRKDADDILKKYPHFEKNHPDFNPNDALYKKTNEILSTYIDQSTGRILNPRAYSLSVKLAEDLLGVNRKSPDLSDEFNLHSPNAPKKEKQEDKEIPLTSEEKEVAIRMYVLKAETNPRTGRPFTEAEAVAKATKAKNDRLKSRRIL